eukprot:2062178-Rhodomonas_salina.1
MNIPETKEISYNASMPRAARPRRKQRCLPQPHSLIPCSRSRVCSPARMARITPTQVRGRNRHQRCFAMALVLTRRVDGSEMVDTVTPADLAFGPKVLGRRN